MTEMLVASWDKQEQPGEKSSGPGLRRSSTPQQGVEVATEMGQEAGALCHPSPESTAPKISSIIPLLHCDPTFQPSLWLLSNGKLGKVLLVYKTTSRAGCWLQDQPLILCAHKFSGDKNVLSRLSWEPV